MAFNKFSLVRFAESFVDARKVRNMFFFATADAEATVATAGYFNDGRAQLSKGDVIVASVAIDDTPDTRTYVVTAAPATGNVTVALSTATADA